MGILSTSKTMHHGTEEAQSARNAGAILLPIFAANFTGHGVGRTEFMSSLNIDSNTGRRAVNNKPPAVSDEGWGVHANGMVDCLNPRAMARWSMAIDPDNWKHLWNTEATPDELAAPPMIGHRSLLRRLITTVQYQPPPGMFFIPNPEEWCMMVNVGMDKLNGAYAAAYPRPETDPAGAELRRKLMRKRPPTLRLCMDK